MEKVRIAQFKALIGFKTLNDRERQRKREKKRGFLYSIMKFKSFVLRCSAVMN